MVDTINWQYCHPKMRRFSLKRQKRNREVKQFRDDFRKEIKLCEHCQKRPVQAIHEIARGSHRQKALDKRYAILRLCDPGCHQEVGGWPICKQLALLALRRPNDYDLDAYWQLTSRRFPEFKDVLWEYYLMRDKHHAAKVGP